MDLEGQAKLALDGAEESMNKGRTAEEKKRLRKSVADLAWKTSPANSLPDENGLRDLMWRFLMDRGQVFDEESAEHLKSEVYELINITTQKSSGTEATTATPYTVNWKILDMLTWQIVCGATALVLSGVLDKIDWSVINDSDNK